MSKQTEGRERLLERLRALIALRDNPGNEEEAAVASAKIAEMLQRYQLSMEEVLLTDPLARDEILGAFIRTDVMRTPTDSAAKAKWIHYLLGAIGRSFQVEPLIYGRRGVCFFGRTANAEAAAALFSYLYRVMNHMVDAAKDQYKREFIGRFGYSPWQVYSPAKWRTSWLIGCSFTIAVRLDAQNSEFQASGAVGLVVYSRDELHEALANQVSVEGRSRARKNSVIGSALELGQRRGQDIGLEAPTGELTH